MTEPSEEFILKTIKDNFGDGFDVQYVAAYFFFESCKALHSRANDDSKQFLENINDLCNRISRNLEHSFKIDDAIKTRLILDDHNLNFTFTELTPEIVQQLQNCALPPKTDLVNLAAQSINKVANLAIYARDLNIINEIDRATKTDGYSTIIIVYGSRFFSITQQAALESLVNRT